LVTYHNSFWLTSALPGQELLATDNKPDWKDRHRISFCGRPVRRKAVSTCGATLCLAARRWHPFHLASRHEENIQSVLQSAFTSSAAGGW